MYGETNGGEPTTYELIKTSSAGLVSVVTEWTHPGSTKYHELDLNTIGGIGLSIDHHYSMRVKTGSAAQGKGYSMTMSVIDNSCYLV
jgi:hypothetical protein